MYERDEEVCIKPFFRAVSTDAFVQFQATITGEPHVADQAVPTGGTQGRSAPRPSILGVGIPHRSRHGYYDEQSYDNVWDNVTPNDYYDIL